MAVYAELMADHRNPVGGRLTLHPSDGVAVELSSRTAGSVIEDGRGVRLITGESYVAAVRRRRAFATVTDRMRIVARDAEFNVQALANHKRVACVTGELGCESGGQSMRLAANEALSLDAGGRAHRSRIDAAKESAWRRGLLIFERAPLAEVVDQINLYRPGRIVLSDPSLGRLPLDAVFHTGQIENSVLQIAQLLNLRARHLGGGVVLLG